LVLLVFLGSVDQRLSPMLSLLRAALPAPVRQLTMMRAVSRLRPSAFRTSRALRAESLKVTLLLLPAVSFSERLAKRTLLAACGTATVPLALAVAVCVELSTKVRVPLLVSFARFVGDEMATPTFPPASVSLPAPKNG
jgi:hypothetical protein